MTCSRSTKDVGGRKCWHPDSYYLGSAESPLCLLLSPAEELSSQKVLPLLHAVAKWNLLTDPLSLYGRRLCRTVPACCTGMTCQNVRALQMFAAADILTPFSEKNQKPNSAHKCPITSIQIRIESQKLSKFSCITFRSLNRGRPPFQLLSLIITSFWSWGGYYGRGGGGGGQGLISVTLLARPVTRSSLGLNSCGLIHV